MRDIVRQPAVSQSPVVEADSANSAARFDLRRALQVIRRRRGLLAITVLILMAASFLLITQLRERYTATTLVVVDSRDSQMLGFQPGISDATGMGGAVDTEVEIARSARVLERTATATDIAHWPYFSKRPTLAEIVKSLLGKKAEPPPSPDVKFADLPRDEQARLLDRLADATTVRRLGLTSVIAMSATADTAENAAVLANAVADAYLTEQISAKVGSNERASEFLRKRVDELATRITELESQLDDFVTGKLSDVASPEAKDLLKKLDAEAKVRASKAETLAQLKAAIEGNDASRLAQLLVDQQGELADRRAKLAAELATQSDAAKIAEAKQALEALDAQIRAAATSESTGLQTDIALSDSRSTALRAEIANALLQTKLPKDISVELFRLQRDIEASRTLYESYLTKLRQLEQQTDFTVPDSRIIAAATPPSEPSFPPRNLFLAGAFLLSLGIGVGFAFLRENFVGGITDEDQLEGLSGIPVIGGVPRYSGRGTPDRAVLTEPLSSFSEAIRRIRLGIESFLPGRQKVVLITSTLPDDGKTTIALALARQFAASGVSTLLIDADLRHPHVHQLLGEAPKRGLIDFLAPAAGMEVADVVVIREPGSGLSIITGSKRSDGPTDTLLMSPRFGDLIKFTKENYEVVIVDTPPIGLVVDASIVARHCDLGIFVVRYASTGQQEVVSSLRDLARGTDLPFCGVLNQIAEADRGSKRRYRNYYR